MVRIMAIWFTISFLVNEVYPQQSALFEQIDARQSGINFTNEIKENDALNVLAYEYFYNGGGVAIGDINNDGLADIFFTANIKSNKLYLNKGNFQFDDITKPSGTGGRKDWKTGVTMADINGDGWLDIYVSYSGKGNADSRRNELYINNKNLTFTERAEEYGLDDHGCSTQAAFFDYDRDGDLDCYVLNHNIKAYKNIELAYLKTEYDSLAADRLYRNDNGHFNDVSIKAGITGNPVSFGLGIAVSDINCDGLPDLYISNDYTEQDYCYMNNRDGSFSQREHYMFTHLSHFSMGSDIGDINNDGLVDILTLDMLPEDNRRQKLLQAQENYELYQNMAENGFHYQFMRNMLHLNNGNGTFSEIGQLAGVSNTDWSWSPLFADFDNDGNKDLFVTNGYMRDYTNKDFLKYWGDYLVKQAVNRDSINYLDIIKLMPVTLLSNYAFKNNGDLTFKNVSATWGIDQPALSNGAAYADLDNDGDLDIVVNNINAPAGIYKNTLKHDTESNYLCIQLKGTGNNKFGLGAKVWCYAGSKLQFLEQMPTRGYQSSVSEVLHFGLGSTTVADSVIIQWQNGSTQVFRRVTANQVFVVTQDSKSFFTPIIKKQNGVKYFAVSAPLFDYSHLQLEYNDFKRQPLMPLMHSSCGPKMVKGDLNNDELEDIFLGSSQGQSSELFIQQPDGKMIKQVVPDFISDSFSVTTDIILFDANGDKLLDIYCASGGYNDFTGDDERLQDRLFINNGKGQFSLAKDALPVMNECTSAIAAGDIDGDGDMDLFAGGNTIPGRYPEPARSFLLLNNNGKFTDVAEQWMKGLSLIGRINDAAWIDINDDKKPDLILAGEWMPIRIFINTGHSLEPVDAGLNNTSGWWNTLELFDADNDGDMDMIAGNWGLNSQFRSNINEPVELYYKDFDNNGSVDPFLCCYIQGKSYPYISRDELLDQVYPYRKKFTSYKSYADACITDILTADEIKTATKLSAVTLATAFFENKDGRFIQHSLPVQAQYSPVYKILKEDLNKDGFTDLLLFGNNDQTRLKIGKMDANFGTVLINNGDNSFRYAGYSETGLAVAGDIKDAEIMKTVTGRFLILGINNNDCLTIKINE